MNDKRQIVLSLEDLIDGEPVTPSAVPLSLLREFAKDVDEFIRGSDIPAGSSKVLVSIDEGSLQINPLSDVSSELYRDVAMLDAVADVSALDPKRAAVILRWQRQAIKQPMRRYKVADIAHGHVVTINNTTRFFESDASKWMPVQRKVLGEIQDMGGSSKPNVHIKTSDGILVVQSDQKLLADEKENRLYKWCLVTISADENIETGELRNERLVRFEPYEPKVRQESISRLRQAGFEAWEGIEAVEWTRRNRGS